MLQKSVCNGGINLEEFCKVECVIYTKMCNCLGRLSSEMENSFASVKSEFDVNLKDVC